jgi:hypothetical protein
MTQLLLYLSLGVTAIVVVVLVVYLVGIIIALRQTKNDLAKLAGGLIAVRDNTQPLPEHIQNINGGLSALLGELVNVNGNLAAIVSVAGNLPNKNN